MTMSWHHLASAEASPEPKYEPLDRIDRAVAELRNALRAYELTKTSARKSSLPGQSLTPGGVVLITDDGMGVGRAIAADLKSLGHPVVRVRHGVGDGPIEGVNLMSAAAVAAMIERVRSHGPLAAIIHAAPLAAAMSIPASWGEPDHARVLGLLAQASSDELLRSATTGGSCLVIARHETDAPESDRLARWIEISSRSLRGVRVRQLSFVNGGEPEVIAADIVRAVLGTDEIATVAGQIRTAAAPSHAFLMGAPDRASWIHLAAALIDWLGDSPDVRMCDLALTLHHNQPAYPFRVGLVADSHSDLIRRLTTAICRLSNPESESIYDLAGLFWSKKIDQASKSPKTKVSSTRRIRIDKLRACPPETHEQPTIASLLDRSGRDWRNHIAAHEFARDGRISPEHLRRQEGAKIIDLSLPLRNQPSRESSPIESSPPIEQRPLTDALDSLDAAIRLRSELLRILSDSQA